jgi:hypothetical protein
VCESVCARCIACTNGPDQSVYTSSGSPTPFDNNCAWACAPGYVRKTAQIVDDAGCVLAVRDECWLNMTGVLPVGGGP